MFSQSSFRYFRRAFTAAGAATAALIVLAPSALAATPAQLVARTLVSGADIPASYRVAPAPARDLAQPTVDPFCNKAATTERFRRARQIRVVLTGSQTADFPSVRHEVVAYDTPARAALAMKEWQAGMVHCRTVTMNIFGTTVTIKTSPPQPLAALPVRDNAVLNVQLTSTAKTQVPSYDYVVVQRQGTVLSIVRGRGTVADKSRTIAYTLRIARATGLRQIKP